ncbi:serpin family protein [Streptomyces sp. enrichment culture]|uniref:serpin family protein n=1 Tax=Streptomyces sp. enrichment culture TaxID=1795815 RepID=UPI003F564612
MTNTTIRAVNRLTARWAGEVSGGTVFSAAGVWPLLAFLADGAAGEARAELAAALGTPADEAAAAGRELLATLRGVPGLEAALGLWTARAVELRQEWEAGLPLEVRGVLTGVPDTDRRALDAWAAQRTGGLIERMPVTFRPDTALLLAGALALRTDWEVPFKGDLVPWDNRLECAGLTRSTTGLDDVAVARTPGGAVTEARVRGTDGVDVHLLPGEPEMSPGEVVAAGTGVLAGETAAVPGSRLPPGAAGSGLRVERRTTLRPEPPSLSLTTVEFALAADHDLVARPGPFGLTTAADGVPGHFPGISAAPLGLAAGRQSATATFGSEGFRAAAVTVMDMAWLSLPDDEPVPEYETVRAYALYDRPFGFLAVHRATRLVLAAGWVTDPNPFPEDEGAYAPSDSES